MNRLGLLARLAVALVAVAGGGALVVIGGSLFSSTVALPAVVVLFLSALVVAGLAFTGIRRAGTTSTTYW